MKQFDSLVDALNDLRSRGYTTDFNLRQNCLVCDAHDIALEPDEFSIDEVYRFEGMTDPDDSAILYAISAKNGRKGVLVNAYGVYADDVSDEMIARLQSHH